MWLLNQVRTYVDDVFRTIEEVLAFDDPQLCGCADDRWCVDCALGGGSSAPPGLSTVDF